MAEVRETPIVSGGRAPEIDVAGVQPMNASVALGLRSSAAGSARRYYPQLELTMARFREFSREPELIFWVFIFPLLLTFSLGIAFRNTGPEKVYVAVESDGGKEAEQLSRLLSTSPDIKVTTLTKAEAALALRSGKVALVVSPIVKDDTAANTAGSAGPPASAPAYNCRFDPTRPESRMARLVFDNYLQRALGRADVASLDDQKITEPGARYVDFLVPGLLGMSLMGGGFFGVGIAIVVARARRLLKMFAATPMKRSHYLLSFIYSRLIFWVMELTAILVFARIAFGFRIQGALLSMVFLLLLGGFTFAGVGMLVAARPKTIQGVSGLSNLVMIPMWLLSGTFFSPSRFPDFLQPFISALPLTALNTALRGVMNEGASLTSHWTDICILLAWGILSFIVTLKIFRWQ